MVTDMQTMETNECTIVRDVEIMARMRALSAKTGAINLVQGFADLEPADLLTHAVVGDGANTAGVAIVPARWFLNGRAPAATYGSHSVNKTTLTRRGPLAPRNWSPQLNKAGDWLTSDAELPVNVQ
jgi:hypothetical protein